MWSILALLIACASALYIDEAGVRDWARQHVGAPKFLRSRDRSFVIGTDEAVVASLSTKTGKIRWRAVLPKEESIEALEIVESTLGHVTSLSRSKDGCWARTWHGVDGGLIWDAFMPFNVRGASDTWNSVVAASNEMGIQGGLALGSSGDEGPVVIATCAGIGWGYLARSGAFKGRIGPDQWASGSSSPRIQTLGASSNNVLSGYNLDTNEITFATLNLASNSLRDQTTSSGLESCSSPLIQGAWLGPVTGIAVGCKSQPGFRVVLSNGESGEYATSSGLLGLEVRENGVKLGRSGDVRSFGNGGFLGLAEGGRGRLVAVTGGEEGVGMVGGAGEVEVEEGGSGVKLVDAGEVGKGAGVMGDGVVDVVEGEGVVWRPFEGKLGGKKVFEVEVVREKVLGESGEKVEVDRVFGWGESSVVVVGSNGEVKTSKWVREEGLARVTNAAAVDAQGHPRRGQDPAGDPSLSMDVRLKDQWRRVMETGEAVQKLLQDVLAQPLNAVDRIQQALHSTGAAGAVRDRVVVVRTRDSRLSAVSLQDGSVQWSRYSVAPKCAKGASPSGALLVTVRVAAATEGFGPVVLLAESWSDEATGKEACSRLRWVDAWSGDVVTEELWNGVEVLALAPFRGEPALFAGPPALERAFVVFAKREGTLGASLAVPPDSSDASSKLDGAVFHSPCDGESLVPTTADKASGLCGFRVSDGAAGREAFSSSSSPPKKFATVVLDWSVAAERNGRLLAWVPALDAASRYSHADTQAAARVRGDDSLLLAAPSAQLALAVTGSDSRITARLVDAATGFVVESWVHEGATGPVLAEKLGDTFVYTLWNAKARRSELVSLLPHGGAVATFALNPFRGPRTVGGSSSSTSTSPDTLVLTQTFLLPSPPVAILSSTTHAGVSRRRLLVATDAGSLLTLEDRLLDPRRPMPDDAEAAKQQLLQATQAVHKTHPAEAKEGLLAYSPHLPLRHLDIVSHNRTLPRIRLLHAAPADIESSSLLLAAGLDLFGARVTIGARAFDEMAQAFPKPIVLLIVLVAAAALPLVWTLVSRKQLQDAWK